jgi:hypothetical protein
MSKNERQQEEAQNDGKIFPSSSAKQQKFFLCKLLLWGCALASVILKEKMCQ